MNATRPSGPAEEPAVAGRTSRPGRSRPQPAPTVLYRQPGIVVTAEWFIAAGRRFPIRELAQLRTVRGPHHPAVSRIAVVAGLALVVVGAALSFTSDVSRLSAETYLALGAAAFVPVLIAAFGQRLRPRSFELWAYYRGQPVLVFSSDDERQYGQVTRALLRAQERARLGGVAEPVASMDPWRPMR